MSYPIFFDSRNSLNLFELQDKFKLLKNLYIKKTLPKVLMLTGEKGSGKSTLVNHFLHSIFDENYNLKNNKIEINSIFLKEYKKGIFSNIIYIKGADFKSVKIEDIRNLKSKIFQSTILNKDRFIIFDDIDLFNHNSLNALLKTIEEPSKNTYFFLINNKARPLLETIKSRALEIKILLNESQRLKIIDKLTSFHELELILDPKTSIVSPGNFLKFNYLFKEYNISLNNDFCENISLLLNLYKKDKEILFINLIFFIVDHYFINLNNTNDFKNFQIYETKDYILNHINKFMLYNINQNALLNAISSKLKYE
jgi:GTPase SAR1 family protein